jgi:hypothetical protein
MPHDQQAVEQTKRDCRDDELIHRRDAVGMIIEKCFPTLGRRASTPGHILGDARLRDLKPELEQFAVDAWRAPKRIFDAHPPDQYAQLRVDLRSPTMQPTLQDIQLMSKHRVLSFKAQLRLTPPPPGDRRRFAWRARPVRAPQRGPVPRVHRDAWGIGALRSGAV